MNEKPLFVVGLKGGGGFSNLGLIEGNFLRLIFPLPPSSSFSPSPSFFFVFSPPISGNFFSEGVRVRVRGGGRGAHEIFICGRVGEEGGGGGG